MARKYLVLTLLLLVISVFFLSGCSPGSANVTPTPDPSVVWSDDFEDGDFEGWEEDDPGWYVNDGVLTSGPDAANPIIHESKVSTGTWSFDLNFDNASYYSICLSCDQDFKNGFGIHTVTTDNTLVALNTISDGTFRSPAAEADLAKPLTGWNHFDITRDASGNSKIYVNGKLVIEYKDDVTLSPQLFFLDVEDLGLAFDNLVVRDQVTAIQP